MASTTRVARYTAQLVIMVTPELKGRIVAEAVERGVSHSTIAREWLERGAPIESESADPFAPIAGAIEAVTAPRDVTGRRRGLAAALKRP